MGLALIVAGLVYAAYLFAAKGFYRWEQGLNLQNTVHVFQQQLQQDLQLAHTVMADTVAGLYYIIRPDREVVYQWQADRVLRNGHLFHPIDITISGFEIQPQSVVANRSASENALVVYAAALQNAHANATLRGRVVLRNRPLWSVPEVQP